MTIWGDTWYVTYLKTLGLTVLGLALVVAFSYLLDKHKKKAPSRQAKGAQETTHNYYTTKGANKK